MQTDGQFVERRKNHESIALYEVYKRYYPMVERMVMANAGTSDDAKDIFQETVLILVQNTQKEDFSLTSSLKTYIYSISKNLWLKKLRNDKQSIISTENLLKYSEISLDEFENDKISTSKYLNWMISQIPVHCQRLIRYIFFLKYTIEKVSSKMGYNNKHTTSNMKYKCLQQMKHVSKANPIY